MDARRNGGKCRSDSSLAPAGGIVAGRDAAAHVGRRLASREWWLFVVNEGRGIGFLAHLERRYYGGEAGRDFEVLALPALREGLGFVALCLLKKSRLPPERLQREIADRVGLIGAGELQDRDVFVLHPETGIAAALAALLYDFLAGRPGPEDD
jgi:hypothetical protein